MSDRNFPDVPIIGSPGSQAMVAAQETINRMNRQQEPNAPGLTANCDIHDSEILEIEGVLALLNGKARDKQRVSYEAFDREIRERFEDLGFIVQVAWWDSNVPGVLIPEICINDRTERKTFDHDQKVAEVTSDILGLGDKGVIHTNPGDFEVPKGHQH